MKIARVVGNIWATRKHPGLANGKLLLVQVLDEKTGEVTGEPAMAMDKCFGAGPGDTVLIVDEGGAARQILNDKSAPVRLVIAGIVDEVSALGKRFKYH